MVLRGKSHKKRERESFDLLLGADSLLESVTGGGHLVPTDLHVLSGAGVNKLDVVHRPALLLGDQAAVGVGDLLTVLLLHRSAVLDYDGVTHVLALRLVETILSVLIRSLQRANLLCILMWQREAATE